MSQQDPACFRRPRKQRRIVRTAEAHILHTNYIEGWVAAEQRSEDVVVEVFVREPAQFLGPTTREQPVTDAVRRPGGLVELPCRAARITPLGQVFLNF